METISQSTEDQRITHMLQSSIARQHNVNKKAMLEDEIRVGMAKKIVGLESQVMYLKVFLAKFLEEQEGFIDTTHGLASPEIAVDYLVAARYMEKHFGRDNHRIDEVQQWLDGQ